MPTYTVHEPYSSARDMDERATRLVFVKEGFALLAFVMPVLWLLFNRLFLVLILFLAVTGGVVGGIVYAGGDPALAAWASFVINLIFGFEARNIHRAMLSLKGYEVIGVVTGRDLEAAERRFLSEWLANPPPPRIDPASQPDELDGKDASTTLATLPPPAASAGSTGLAASV